MTTARPDEPILHVDMDAFYASVEQRDAPALVGRPVAVGGIGDRGVVAAASYEAREFGVRSAMPMAIARRRCPQLVVIRPRIEVYRAVSTRVLAILRDVTPLVEPVSLDEAFLDVSGAGALFGSPPTIGATIRRRIREELSLPCSVGVAPTRSVAKLLSSLAKPDGILHWPTTQVAARLRPLPVEALWGVGPRAREQLDAAGVHTIGDVVDVDPVRLERAIGSRAARRLRELACGIDHRGVDPTGHRRSISSESTFPRDVADPAVIERRLRRQAATLGRKLRTSSLVARTTTVKVRDADFSTRTRSATGQPTDRTDVLIARALDLWEASGRVTRPVRLVGVAVSGLEPAGGEQLRLDATGHDERWVTIDHLTDEVSRRFGDAALAPAALVRRRGVDRSSIR